MLFNKKSAMTYAEMIVVIGLIGVVASLTIPGMKKYSQRVEYGRLAEKAYLTLEQALDASALDNDSPQHWNFTDSDLFSTKIDPYIKKKAGSATESIDGMIFEQAEACSAVSCPITVHVNGDSSTSVENRTRFTYNIDKETVSAETGEVTVKVNPTGMAVCLRNNNWDYTEELWKNGCS